MRINSHTQLTGVIGYPVKHSLSPAMQNAAFRALEMNWVYLAFEVAPERLHHAVSGMRGLGIRGLNATIPHKEALFPLVDDLTDAARQIRAVNTLFWDEAKLIGENTDAEGFLQALREAGFDPHGASALVAGAGGSARAVVYALKQVRAEINLCNRSLDRAKQLADTFGIDNVYPLEPESLRPLMPTIDLVVNCTSLGMEPEAHSIPPIPLEHLPAHAWVHDLVYRPLKTQLLQRAEALGLNTLGGLDMLLYQGAAAFTRWTGESAPVQVMKQTLIGAL
jgi:shikimate dehydrogenase